MTSEIRKLTRMGGDVRKIAALLQSKGRGRDTILAHITPQEAALLKARGGRGSTNPDTGLLEFEDDAGNIEDYRTSGGDTGGGGEEYATPSSAEADVFFQPTVEQPIAPVSEIPAFTPATQEATPTQVTTAPGAEFGIGAPTGAGDQPSVAAPVTQPGLADRAAAATGLSKDALAKALGIGIQGIGTGILARRAGKEGQAAAKDIQALGAPYRAKAQELMAQAQSGQLSAVGQQQVQALQAQLAQQQAGRGGVGAAQAAQTVERFRQQLLSQQYDLGLKLSGVADQFALRAIQQGLTADQQINQLLGTAMGNIGAIFAGQPKPQVPGGQ